MLFFPPLWVSGNLNMLALKQRLWQNGNASRKVCNVCFIFSPFQRKCIFWRKWMNERVWILHSPPADTSFMINSPPMTFLICVCVIPFHAPPALKLPEVTSSLCHILLALHIINAWEFFFLRIKKLWVKLLTPVQHCLVWECWRREKTEWRDERVLTGVGSVAYLHWCHKNTSPSECVCALECLSYANTHIHILHTYAHTHTHTCLETTLTLADFNFRWNTFFLYSRVWLQYHWHSFGYMYQMV